MEAERRERKGAEERAHSTLILILIQVLKSIEKISGSIARRLQEMTLDLS